MGDKDNRRQKLRERIQSKWPDDGDPIRDRAELALAQTVVINGNVTITVNGGIGTIGQANTTSLLDRRRHLLSQMPPPRFTRDR